MAPFLVRLRFPTYLLILALLAGSYVACGDDNGELPPPPPDDEVESIEVSPGTATLEAVGATVQLQAAALDADGSQLSGVNVTWTSSDGTVASVDSNGLVTAEGDGTATVIASVGLVSGEATVTVDQVVESISITPDEASVAEGETVDFDATALDANDNEVSDATVTWSSTDEGVATVDDDGVATGVSQGTATIRATTDAGPSADAELTVRAGVDQVEVTPADVELDAIDATAALEATARDDEGDPVPGVSFEWSSSDASVASVDQDGVVTAAAEGMATITAGADGMTGEATVTVDQVVTAVSITPDAETIEVGGSADFDATAEDANGNAVADAVITWSSSDQAVATVDDEGTVTGVAEGTATIRAESDTGPFAEAELTVTAPSQVTLAIVSGDDQTRGRTQQDFGDPLVVEVTDGNGNPLAGTTVNWSVEEGDATLSSNSTETDASGQAQVTATADTLLLAHSVQASVEGEPGTDPVTFSLETSIAYFEIGDNFFRDWQGRQNTNFEADGNISVGDEVMWEYASGATSHTVTSGEGPSGGGGDGLPDGATNGMNSGNMSPGDTFTWMPDAAGTWEYFCQVHPTIMHSSRIIVDEASTSTSRADTPDYEPGDVVQPEGSHFKFVYVGPPSKEK